jgi:hypothetical protein
MDAVRQSGPPTLVTIPEPGAEGTTIDVGLVDIPITFAGPLPLVASNLEHRAAEFLEANLRHIDGLFAGTFHDQMTLVSVLHAVRPDGTPEIHYHKLVFGVRREWRGEKALVGPLDFEPMLAVLGRRLRVGVVA